MINRREIINHPKRSRLIAIILLSSLLAFIISNLFQLGSWLDVSSLSLSLIIPISVLLLIIQSVIKPGKAYTKLHDQRKMAVKGKLGEQAHKDAITTVDNSIKD